MIGRPNDEQGFALVFVLWAVTILAVIGVGLLHQTGTAARIARSNYDHAQAGALADTGVSVALLELLDPAKGKSLLLDGSSRELSFGEGTLRLRLQDERGKVDLNQADSDTLANLLRVAVGASEQEGLRFSNDMSGWKKNRLASWAGPDEVAARTASGPFLAIEELLRVPGVTRQIYRRLQPYITVWSAAPTVDPASAPAEVLLSLPGANPDDVEAFVSARTRYGPDLKGLAGLPGLQRYLSHDGAGVYVSVRSSAISRGGGRFIREATISFIAAGGQRYRFVSWGEGEAEPKNPGTP